MSNSNRKGLVTYKTLIYAFFMIVTIVCFVIPFVLIISISFTSEEAIRAGGYSLFPKQFTLLSYKYIFSNPQQILNAYVVTSTVALLGTFLSVVVMSMCAYSLARKNFKFRNQITFFIFFTMLFSGGIIPSYILNTTYLHLNDKIFIYMFPNLANAMSIIIFRTFFKDIAMELIEAAKIDGAREIRIFAQIVLPLSKPVLATIAFMCLLDRWNDWFTSLLYIQNEKLYTLQYLLQRILREAEFIRNMAKEAPGGIDENLMQQAREIPTEGMRYALCIIAAGPMMVVFPFFQKYFVKGLTVGAIKG